MSERKTFKSCLEESISTIEELSALRSLMDKAEKRKSVDKKNLLKAMEDEILNSCSLDFLTEMKKEVSAKIRNVNALNYGVTNMHYLVEVIRGSLIGLDMIGFDNFICPGNDYGISSDFAGAYSQDFIRLKEKFGLEMQHCPDVKIGYAYRFYKP